MTELFIVEYENGEALDLYGDGGFSVFTSRAEAQDAMDNVTEDIPLVMVRFVRATA